MEERIRQLYFAGENCGRCILISAAEKYGITITKQLLDSVVPMSAGFGIGGICTALVAAVMILGIMLDETAARQKSLMLFAYMQEKWGGIDCCILSQREENCANMLADLGMVLERVIETDNEE